MKIKLNSILASSIIFAIVILNFGCRKKTETPASTSDNYSSLYDFYAKNAPKSQFYKINSSTGGSFTTSQGTKVTIGPNSFVDVNGNLVSGNVAVEFKDLYKKSDMLLSQMLPMLGNGAPLVSGGEFFINPMQIIGTDTIRLKLDSIASVKVQQPNNGKDSSMQAYVIDSSQNQWVTTHLDTLNQIAGSYVFSLYRGSDHYGRGTWCNSDDPSYFSAFKQTKLTVYASFNTADYGYSDVYLIFNGINSMVHVYPDASNEQFPYTFAPKGLQCTVVAVGVKDNSLWASFTPVTILDNQSVTISIAKISTTDFMNKLKALDN